MVTALRVLRVRGCSSFLGVSWVPSADCHVLFSCLLPVVSFFIIYLSQTPSRGHLDSIFVWLCVFRLWILSSSLQLFTHSGLGPFSLVYSTRCFIFWVYVSPQSKQTFWPPCLLTASHSIFSTAIVLMPLLWALKAGLLCMMFKWSFVQGRKKRYQQ